MYVCVTNRSKLNIRLLSVCCLLFEEELYVDKITCVSKDSFKFTAETNTICTLLSNIELKMNLIEIKHAMYICGEMFRLHCEEKDSCDFKDLHHHQPPIRGHTELPRNHTTNVQTT